MATTFPKFGPIRLALALLLAVLVVWPMGAAAEEAREQVRKNYDRIEATLQRSSVGDAWRDYLRLAELKSQLDHTGEPDLQAIAAIHKRFATDHEVLRRARFLAMRKALEAWMLELNPPGPEELAKLTQAARGSYHVPTAQQVNQSLAKLRDAAGQLDRYLNTLRRTQAGWRRYLKWPVLAEQIKAETTPDPTALESVRRRLAATVAVAGSPTIAETAKALRTATPQLLAAASDAEAADEQLETLAAALTAEAKRPDEENRQQIAEVLGWLEARGQASELVAAVRRVYGQPNFYLEASAPFLAAGVDRNFHEDRSPFRETLLGTTYSGMRESDGSVAMELFPDDRRIAIRYRFNATVQSNANGGREGVSVSTASTTQINGSKWVTINARGIYLHPATASATTSSSITNIGGGGGRFRRRAVNDRVYSEKGATDQAASAQAERRSSRQFDATAAERIGPMQARYRDNIRRPLIERDAFPRQTHFYSTKKLAGMVLTEANAAQLAASTGPPEAPSGADLNLRIHQSFVDNLTALTLAGRTYHEQKFEQDWKNIFGSTPEALKTVDAERPWTITFAQEAPLTVDVGDGKITIHIRADRFTVGEKKYPGMWISAEYTLETTGDGLVGRRAEQLRIVPPGFESGEGKRVGVRYQVFRSMLRKRFGPIFSETLEFHHLDLPEAYARAGRLLINLARADSGWLTLSCKFVKHASAEVAKE